MAVRESRAQKLCTLRCPGCFVVWEMGSNASLWSQKEHGQLPEKANLERKDLGAAVGTLHQG